MNTESENNSFQTEGRVLNNAAFIYDFVQPLITFGQEKKINRKITESLNKTDESNILDIGCGTGVLSGKIAEQNINCRVTGIDASLSMVKTASKKRGTDNCSFMQALGEDLPFKESTFNIVTSALFFHHINRDLKKKCLNEIMRVLRPGGKLIIADMCLPYTIMGKIISYSAWKLLRQPEIKENIDGILTELVKEEGFINFKECGKYSGYISIVEAEKKNND